MIDSASTSGSWARFFAQRDGTPFTPLTDAEQLLRQAERDATPHGGSNELRIGADNIVHHKDASA